MPKSNTIVVTPGSLNLFPVLPTTKQGFNGRKVPINTAIKNPTTVTTGLRSEYEPKKT